MVDWGHGIPWLALNGYESQIFIFMWASTNDTDQPGTAAAKRVLMVNIIN